MATSRGSCLIVLSSAAEGVSATSFMQACTLINQSFAIQLASPGGRQAEYVNQDDSNRRWFNEFRSKASSTPIALDTVDEPICAVGLGVAGLCSARKEDGKSWWLEDFCLTAPSLFEVGYLPEFPMMPLVLEDFIKDYGGKYTASEPDEVHVVIDRNIITGQNHHSTMAAVQNLILICSQKQTRLSSSLSTSKFV
ncbi:hypothetical protein BsWGS_19293 [Bradybaena similaris]